MFTFILTSNAGFFDFFFLFGMIVNGKPKPSTWRVVQLDRTDVKVIGEMEDVLVHLASNDKVCQVINIVVADIPDAYGLVLSRDWSTKLNGYFASNWSHLAAV